MTTLTYTPGPTRTLAPPVVQRTRPQATNDRRPLSLLWLLFGLVATISVGTYMVLYARNAAALDRYAQGFPVWQCPVCGEGILDIEEKVTRMLRIPRVRRTVRCNNCRSVLREVGKRRWRYAVDPTANSELYRNLNNRVLHENRLRDLAPSHGFDAPFYVDEN
jgi:YgiT-type zinc finger domain-containing protein